MAGTPARNEDAPLRNDGSLSAGNLSIDLDQYLVLIGDAPVDLTYQEFELLRLLFEGRDRILSYDELTSGLWNGHSADARRRLGVVVCRLRAKLDATWPYHIQTVRSRGYGLTLHSDCAPASASPS